MKKLIFYTLALNTFVLADCLLAVNRYQLSMISQRTITTLCIDDIKVILTNKNEPVQLFKSNGSSLQSIPCNCYGYSKTYKDLEKQEDKAKESSIESSHNQ